MSDPKNTANQNSVPTRQKRNYLIDPSFQWKYALNGGLMVFCLSSLIGTVLYKVLHSQARLRTMDPGGYSAEVTMIIVGFGLAFAVLTACTVGVWCMWISHRIAGPLHLMEKYFQELAGGDFPRVRALRSKDEFKNLHLSLARTVNALRERRQQEYTCLNDALDQAKASLVDAGPRTKQELKEAIFKLESLVSTVGDSLGVGLPPAAEPTLNIEFPTSPGSGHQTVASAASVPTSSIGLDEAQSAEQLQSSGQNEE